MNRFTSLPIALLVAAASSGVCAADDPVPIKSHWEGYAQTTDEPRHIGSLGPAKLLSGTPGNPPTYVILQWARAEYLQPQELGDKTYTVEYQQIQLDCRRHRSMLVRDVKYAADGSLLSDLKIDGKWKPVNFEFEGDTGVLPLTEQFAITIAEFGCY